MTRNGLSAGDAIAQFLAHLLEVVAAGDILARIDDVAGVVLEIESRLAQMPP